MNSRRSSRRYFQLMFVDQSVPRITQQWEGFEFLQQMLTNAVSAIQKAIDAGAFPQRSARTRRCTCCGRR